jgi:hypothetical protein
MGLDGIGWFFSRRGPRDSELGRNGVLTAMMGKGRLFALALTRRYQSIALAHDISQPDDCSLPVWIRR